MKTDTPPNTTDKRVYEIRLEGRLSNSLESWFDGMSLRSNAQGHSILTGFVQDQAALYGLLRKIRDLGLPLLSLHQVNTQTDQNTSA